MTTLLEYILIAVVIVCGISLILLIAALVVVIFKLVNHIIKKE